MTTLNASKAVNRRKLHFEGLDDILADVDRLAASCQVRTLGNWSAGQVLGHLAIAMNKSIDGFSHRPSAILRFVVWLLFKRRLLTRPMPAGFKLPNKAMSEFVPLATTTWEEELGNLRQAIHRLQTETRRSPHLVLGPLTLEEWNQFHCRHSELHLSFLIPAGG